jgi:small subunit ribosomal protein S6
MRLSEDVIRYLTVKQDGPLPAPRSIPTAVAEPVAAEPASV